MLSYRPGEAWTSGNLAIIVVPRIQVLGLTQNTGLPGKAKRKVLNKVGSTIGSRNCHVGSSLGAIP
eukprot:IDg9076t1